MAASRTRCIPQWKKCDLCQTIVSQNDHGFHSSSHCPPQNGARDWTYGHIHEKKLFTFVKTLDLTDDKTEAFLNNSVQVSLAVAQLCEIPIGDPVLITAKNNQSVVKSLWPTEENSLSAVSLSPQSMKELDCDEGPVEVRKLEKLPLPAREICLDLLKPQQMTENQISEMKFLLSATFVNRIIIGGQYLIYYYYGMRPKFKVTDVKAYLSTSSPIDSITEDMANVDIGDSEGDKLYRILPNTLWKIRSASDEDRRKSCSDKYCLSKLGGIDHIVGDLKDAVYNVLAADLVKGQNISCGILLHGIAGTGKTYLANAMVAATKLPVIEINSWEVLSNFLGDGENRLKSLFDDAIARAPSIILMDELQSFCPSKSSSDQEKRLLGYLLILLDKLLDFKVVVIGITRDLESVNAVLRRPGRFDYEIELPVPDANARIEILQRILKPHEHDVAKETIVQLGRTASHGFVGADLRLAVSLANTRAANEAKRVQTGSDQQIPTSSIKNEDLIWAFSQVKPSAMREILVEVPNVKWSDIGGQDDLKLKLQQVLEWPLKQPEAFTRLGITPPRGILLYGPPGCSKTMIAKAVATESQLNFISVKGAELFSKWVGDSEKAVREVFRRARSVSPSVIFFDEIDAITAERDTDGGSGGSNVQERVLSQLLTELDGVQPLANVTIIAATNRPDRIDSALLRPGRLDRKLYVSLPSSGTRQAIFNLQFKKMPVGGDVDVNKLVDITDGYSGAELVAICTEAGIKALHDDLGAEKIEWRHFEYALSVVKPRTPDSLLRIYNKFQECL